MTTSPVTIFSPASSNRKELNSSWIYGGPVNTKNQVLSTIETMTDAFHRGDIDGILRSYEQTAVVVGEPGAPVQGVGPLRAMFAGFIAAQAHFTFGGHEVIAGGDLALHIAPWTMTGVAPDGSPISAAGLSVAVLRRQTDGKWLLVIDNPYGEITTPIEKGTP